MIRKLALISIVGAAAGCATVGLAPLQWESTMAGQDAYPGRVAATVATGITGTVVHVSLAGGTPGATHPWHIHRGTCGNDLGIVGATEAYPALRPGTDGRANASATVNVALIPGDSYFVNVHASPQNLGTIVACSNLRRGTP
jgi:superoxide dismutase, Cu-Zn family